MDDYMLNSAGYSADDPEALAMLGIPPAAKQQALAQNVRRAPAISQPSSAVETPPPAQGAGYQQPQQPKADDYIRQIAERAFQRPDAAPLVEDAKRRQEESRRGLMMAMAMQSHGGESMQPFAGHVFQQALKNQGEREIPGGWGTVSPEGAVWNPAKVNESELQRLQFLAQFEQGREDKREAREQRAADARESRALRATLAGQGREGREEQQRYRLEDQSRNHFDQITKDTRDTLNMGRILQGLPEDRRLWTPLQVQSMMILLNKFQDPGSVVREGEFNRVAQAQAILQKWGNIPQRLARGDPLPPAMVRDLHNTINIYQSAMENTMRETASDYVRNAQQRGLDPAQVVTDLRWHPQKPQQGGGAGGRGIDAGARLQGGGAPAAAAPGRTRVDY